MRTQVIGASILAAVLAATVPVMTITNGQPDGNGHPFVGVMIQFIPNTNFIEVCSGSGISSTRFLTAAHCADPTLPVFVTYKTGPSFSFPADFTQGSFFPNPNWCLACANGTPGFDTHDVAVV